MRGLPGIGRAALRLGWAGGDPRAVTDGRDPLRAGTDSRVGDRIVLGAAAGVERGTHMRYVPGLVMGVAPFAAGMQADAGMVMVNGS
jgi:hypothetical protein